MVREVASGGDAKPVGVAVVGCGDVAKHYVEGIGSHPELALVGAFDRNPGRAAELLAGRGRAYGSLEELLGDEAVEMVINLTRQRQHFDITTLLLERGLHVYSEKPLAPTFAEASRLVELADANGVRLACAPLTSLGDAQSQAWRIVSSGRLGRVRVVYAEANWGRIESWHPRPQDFYDVGPTFDVAVYPLTLVTSILGPAATVRAAADTLLPERRTLDGESFRAAAPDFSTAVLTLQDGTLVRVTASFYVPLASKQKGIEFHGDAGSLHLANALWFDAEVELCEPSDGDYAPVEPDAPRLAKIDYSRGVAAFARAIRAGEPHYGSGAQAAHVVEIIEAIHASAQSKEEIVLTSSFPVPAPPALA
jgi:predicted dehydrogenase